MPNAHPRPWHRNSVFGDGPRRPLSREQRARFRFLLNAHRRVRRLSPLAEVVGNVLVRRLGVDGQLDPAHDTLAADAGCCARTVRRALVALRAVGLVLWQRRLVREGDRVEQTSNAYLLALPRADVAPVIQARHPGGHSGRQSRRNRFSTVQPTIDVSPDARQTALAALERIAAQRLAAVQARLLGRRQRLSRLIAPARSQPRSLPGSPPACRPAGKPRCHRPTPAAPRPALRAPAARRAASGHGAGIGESAWPDAATRNGGRTTGLYRSFINLCSDQRHESDPQHDHRGPPGGGRLLSAPTH